MENQQPQPYYPQPQQPQQQQVTQVIIQEKKSNGLGTAGFVLALLGFILCWIPVVNVILWFLGVVFSCIGIFKKPRGLAITGLILSFIAFIFTLIVLSIAGIAMADIFDV